eukprot:jgi/Mesvir1/28453/Mv15876-RA.1
MQGVLKVQLGEEWWKPIANKLGITVTPRAVEEQLASLKLERARQQAKKRDPNWRRLRKKKKTEAQGGKWKDNKAGGEYEHGSGYAIYGQPVAGQEGGGNPVTVAVTVCSARCVAVQSTRRSRACCLSCAEIVEVVEVVCCLSKSAQVEGASPAGPAGAGWAAMSFTAWAVRPAVSCKLSRALAVA